MASDRRRRIQHDPGSFAERADELQRAMQMRPRLGMHQDVVGAGLGERGDIRIDRRDHQMHVERQSGVRPQAFSTGGPKLMFGTKWPSITSRCSQSAPAASIALHFVAQPAEIGGEQARRDNDSAGSRGGMHAM